MNLTDVANHNDFLFAVCTFIDEFKRNDNKIEMIKDEPRINTSNRVNLCILLQ